MYKRHSNGWTDIEIITGNKSGDNDWHVTTPWPYGRESVWEESYQTAAIERRYKDSRLTYLRDYSKREYYNSLKEKEMLELAIHKKNGFDDPQNAEAFEAYVTDHGYSLSKFKNTHLTELADLLGVALAELSKWRNYYNQAEKLLEYTTKKEKLLKTGSYLLTNEEKLAYLHQTLPKPDYTLHLPPQNGGENLK